MLEHAGPHLSHATFNLAGVCTQCRFGRYRGYLDSDRRKTDVSALPRMPTMQPHARRWAAPPPSQDAGHSTCLAAPLARAGRSMMIGSRRTCPSRPAQPRLASASSERALSGTKDTSATLQLTKSSSSVVAGHRRRQPPHRLCAPTTARRTPTSPKTASVMTVVKVRPILAAHWAPTVRCALGVVNLLPSTRSPSRLTSLGPAPHHSTQP